MPSVGGLPMFHAGSMLAVASGPEGLDSPESQAPHGEIAAEIEAHIAELEAELFEVRALLEIKDADVCKTQQQLARLEEAFRRQASASDLEREHLSRMEADLAQQTGSDPKLAELLLAVAAEKHRADLAERAAGEVTEQVAAEWREAEGRLRHRIEEERCLASEAEERAKESEGEIADLRQKDLIWQQDLEARLAAIDEQRREAVKRAASAEEESASLRGAHGGESSGAAQSSGASELDLAVRELRQQLDEEKKRSAQAQDMLLARECRLLAAEGGGGAAAEGGGGGAVPDAEALRLAREVEARCRDEEGRRLAAEGLVAATDLQLEQAQQQLVGALEKRMSAMGQLAEKGRELEELQQAVEIDGLSWQQSLEGQVFQMQRELCEVQQQIAEELSRRQALQYGLIEKERLVCDLQQQLAGRLEREMASPRWLEEARSSPRQFEEARASPRRPEEARAPPRRLEEAKASPRLFEEGKTPPGPPRVNQEKDRKDESRSKAPLLSARGGRTAQEGPAVGADGAKGAVRVRRPTSLGSSSPTSPSRAAVHQHAKVGDGSLSAHNPGRSLPMGRRSQPPKVPPLPLQWGRASGGTSSLPAAARSSSSGPDRAPLLLGSRTPH